MHGVSKVIYLQHRLEAVRVASACRQVERRVAVGVLRVGVERGQFRDDVRSTSSSRYVERRVAGAVHSVHQRPVVRLHYDVDHRSNYFRYGGLRAHGLMQRRQTQSTGKAVTT